MNSIRRSISTCLLLVFTLCWVPLCLADSPYDGVYIITSASNPIPSPTPTPGPLSISQYFALTISKGVAILIALNEVGSQKDITSGTYVSIPDSPLIKKLLMPRPGTPVPAQDPLRFVLSSMKKKADGNSYFLIIQPRPGGVLDMRLFRPPFDVDSGIVPPDFTRISGDDLKLLY